MNVIEWAEGNWHLENGELVRLVPWQQKFLAATFPLDGSRSRWETFLVSRPKKQAKTETTAIATAYAALTLPAPESIYTMANDLEQARDRTFERIARAFRAMGLEARGEVVVTKNELVFVETGTRIVALPADYAGGAGANYGCTSWTELWAYRHEGHVRLWEELTPLPTRRSLRFVDSYAGFAGDAPVLEPLWDRALAGDQIDDDPPVWVNGKLWAMIDQGEEAQRRGWLGEPGEMENYYAEQRASLRPGTFARLHLNVWQSGEEAFVTSEDWAACIDPELRPLRPEETRRLGLRLSVGVDVATKSDCAAVVAVAKGEDGRLQLIRHRIWTPKKGEPLDLEETVEAFLLELNRTYSIRAVLFDPYQMARSASTLQRAGLRMEEMPQTTGNLTAAGQNLYELIRGRNIALYPDEELRRHALNAVAIETARGWRLAKEKASRKIDGVVALSFASLDAVGRSGPDSMDWSSIVDDDDEGFFDEPGRWGDGSPAHMQPGMSF